MGSRVQKMTEGKPAKLIFVFAMAMTVGNIFQQLYTVVDTMVVGKALGVRLLAALGAGDWLNWMMLGIIEGLTEGFGIMMAKEFGAGHYRQLRKVVGNALLLALVFAVLLVAVGEGIIGPVLGLMQTPADIVMDTKLYLRIMYAGIPIVMFYNVLAAILRALGDGRTPLFAVALASVANIGLDLLFVLGFGWGLAGASSATLIAQLLSALYCLSRIRKINFLQMEKEDYVLSYSRQLLWLGFPMALQNAVIALGGMVVQSVVNGFGVLFIAGFTATNKLYGLLEMAAISYGYAMVTYVGQNYGAGEWQRIRKGMRAALLIALLTSAVVAAVMLLFGRAILSLFISGTPDVIEQTLDIAYMYLAVMSVCLPVLYVLYVVRSAIQGMGNTILPLLSAMVEFMMRTLSALLLPRFIGETGVFFAEVFAWMGAVVVLVISYFKVIKTIPR